MNRPSKGQIGWGIVVVVMVLASLFFGVNLPLPPEPPVEPEQPAAALSDRYFESLIVDKELTSNGTTSLVGVATFGANPVFEGATADAYETTLAITDPTADRTITVPNSSGTLALNPYGASIEFEGATANDFETTLAVTDPTADRTLTLPNETAGVMVSSLVTNGTGITNSVTGASNGLVFEGATADVHETTVSATDPTADRSVVLADASGTVMLSSLATNGADAANAVTGASNGLVFEGATANDFETTITPTDPTADRTITLPDASGVPILSLAVPEAATSLFMAAQDLKYEGSSADEHEGMIRFPTNPTADQIAAIPTSSGWMVLSDADLQGATGFWGAANGLVFEGATANDFETTITPTDPTADRTITLPDLSGTVGLMITPGAVAYGSNVITGTLGISHGLTTPQTVFCTLGADPVDNEEDRCTATISGATVTIKVWKEAASPTAGDSGVLVYWQVAGQP